jgi:hypothetical protein
VLHACPCAGLMMEVCCGIGHERWDPARQPVLLSGFLRPVRGCRTNRGLTADPCVRVCKGQSATHRRTATDAVFVSPTKVGRSIFVLRENPMVLLPREDFWLTIIRLACGLFPHDSVLPADVTGTVLHLLHFERTGNHTSRAIHHNQYRVRVASDTAIYPASRTQK